MTVRAHLGIHACQSSSANRGIGRYVHDLAVHLVRGHPELVAGLYFDPELPVPVSLADFCGPGLLHSPGDISPRDLDPPHDPVIYHAMSPVELEVPITRLFPAVFRNSGAWLAVTLYDLIPFLNQETYLQNPITRQQYRARMQLVEEADLVLAISEATKQDAVSHLGIPPGRIAVIYGGVDPFFSPTTAHREAVLADLKPAVSGLTGPFVFYPGGIEHRKNMEGAIETFAQLPPQLQDKYQLVVGGHMLGSERDALAIHARDLGVGGRVVLPGFVSDSVLRDLYRGCEVMLFPSLYEGLGLPILEAMYCGAPVIASDRSSMRELVTIDAARFNPSDTRHISNVLERALTDEDFRRTLLDYSRRAPDLFSWERTVDLTVEAYGALADACESQVSIGRRRRRNIAVCTPFPPERSGIADYTRRFLETLVDRHPVNVDVVVGGAPESYETPGGSALRIASVRQFDWLARHGDYDTIVYCMGNSEFHDYVYDLLKVHPGTVWLHDIRLTGFYRAYHAARGGSLEILPQELSHWARRYPDSSGDVLTRSESDMHRQGVYLSGEVVHHATRLIVGSAFSRDVVMVDGNPTVPVTVMPHAAMPPHGHESREDALGRLSSKYGLNTDIPLIITLGIVAPTKCPDAILAACGLLPHPATLAFVGPCDAMYRRTLMRSSSHMGADPVNALFTDFVDEEELDSWLAAAAAAIQLRFPTNGESSGAVMRCLAAGVPTIVNAHGSFNELPEDAVIRVMAQPDTNELRLAIQSILADHALAGRLIDGARRYAEEVSIENVVDQFWRDVILAS